MKLFIDSADIQEIISLANTGLVDGVTTNPSLVAESKRNYMELLGEICTHIQGPVSAEVTALDTEEMVRQGLAFHTIAQNITVKLPLTFEGLKACRILADKGIMVNVTLCFSPAQALLAAKAGATFVSPFVGRHDDIGQDGLKLIEDICMIYRNYEDLTTQILVASARTPMHVIESAKMGVEVATLGPKLFRQLIHHPLTDIGLNKFTEDWKKTGQIL